MALPSSGQISMDQIRVELGIPTQSPFGLDEARNGTYVALNPCSTYSPPSSGQVSLSSWYGYDHTEPCPPAYNYYTFTPCVGGAGTDYRSISSLALYDVYSFLAAPPARQCYEITSITASSNNNDLPTIYGPKTDCYDSDCVQP